MNMLTCGIVADATEFFLATGVAALSFAALFCAVSLAGLVWRGK